MDAAVLKNMISENKISDALLEIQRITSSEVKYQYLENKILLLLSRYKALRDEEVKGLISNEDKSIKYNRLTDDILKIIKEIEKPNKLRWISPETFSKNSAQKALISITIMITIIGGCIFYYFYMYNDKANLVLLDDSLDSNDSPYKFSDNRVSFDFEGLSTESKSILTDKAIFFTKNESDTITKIDLRYQLVIDKINNDYRYSFPTIDFKFLNKGGSTAVITEFEIERIELKLNSKPELEFMLEVSGGNLHVNANNYSLGDALGCECELINPTLQNLYRKKNLMFKGEIESYKRELLYNLSVDDVKYSFQKKLINRIECINETYIKCSYYDKIFKHYKEKVTVHPSNDCSLHVYKDEFNMIKKYSRGGQLSTRVSPITYVSFIDKKEDLVYPTLHEIKPGETDRFHIMIAAYKSCYAKVRLKFKTNNNEIVESEPITLEIWKPKEKLKRHDYLDGDILSRKPLNDSKEEQKNKLQSFPKKIKIE